MRILDVLLDLFNQGALRNVGYDNLRLGISLYSLDNETILIPCPNIFITAPSAAPTNIQIMSTETSMKFTFDEIEKEKRNGVIVLYQARLRDPTVSSSAVAPQEKNVTTETVTFTFLKPGTQYLFQVRGWTAAGPGKWSTDAVGNTLRGLWLTIYRF